MAVGAADDRDYSESDDAPAHTDADFDRSGIPEETVPRRIVLGWVSNHPSLLAAASGVVVITLRLIRTAHGDLETAMELLRGGTAAVLIATALQLGPPLVLGATIAVLTVRSIRGDWVLPPVVVVPALTLALLTTGNFLGLVGGVVIAIVCMRVMSWSARLWKRATAFRLSRRVEKLEARFDALNVRVQIARQEDARALRQEVHQLKKRLGKMRAHLNHKLDRLRRAEERSRRAARWLPEAAVIAGSVWAVLFIVLPDTVWMPAEAIVLNDGAVIIGYVREDEPWVRVIEHDGRAVLTIDSDSIDARTVCDRPTDTIGPSWLGLSLIGLLGDRPDHPDCSDLAQP